MFRFPWEYSIARGIVPCDLFVRKTNHPRLVLELARIDRAARVSPFEWKPDSMPFRRDARSFVAEGELVSQGIRAHTCA